METEIIVQCSWCKRQIDPDTGQSFGTFLRVIAIECWQIADGTIVSHGLCNSCLEYQKKEVRTYKSQQMVR